MRNISLKQLRTFAAAVRSGSLSAAARSLNVTPPAVTLQMQLLEEAVGMPLAERTAQGWRPTAAGREVLAAANRVQAALEDCTRAIKEMQGLETGRVTVAAARAAQYLAAPMLAAYNDKHPGVGIGFTIASYQAVIEKVRTFQTDIALANRKPGDANLTCLVIGRQAYVLIAPPHHPLTRQDSVPVEAIIDEPFIVHQPGSETRAIFDGLCGKLAPRIVMETDQSDSVKHAVMAKLGLAFVSRDAVNLELKNGSLSAIALEGTPVWRELYAIRHAERRFLPAAEQLWEFICTHGLQSRKHSSLMSDPSKKVDSQFALGNDNSEAERTAQAG